MAHRFVEVPNQHNWKLYTAEHKHQIKLLTGLNVNIRKRDRDAENAGMTAYGPKEAEKFLGVACDLAMHAVKTGELPDQRICPKKLILMKIRRHSRHTQPFSCGGCMFYVLF